MFTGIIAELGSVTDVEHRGGSARITVRAGALVADLPRGGSLAVDGVCLTAVRAPGIEQTPDGLFTADVMGETLERSTLGTLTPGDAVNLERCLPAGGRLDGHVVQGHVDGVGEVLDVEDHGTWRRLRVVIPGELADLMVEKGSIALGGVSLTLTAVSEPHETPAWVEAGLVPATLAATTLGAVRPGDRLNIEADVLAKHARRLLRFDASREEVPA